MSYLSQCFVRKLTSCEFVAESSIWPQLSGDDSLAERELTGAAALLCRQMLRAFPRLSGDHHCFLWAPLCLVLWSVPLITACLPVFFPHKLPKHSLGVNLLLSLVQQLRTAPSLCFSATAHELAACFLERQNCPPTSLWINISCEKRRQKQYIQILDFDVRKRNYRTTVVLFRMVTSVWDKPIEYKCGFSWNPVKVTVNEKRLFLSGDHPTPPTSSHAVLNTVTCFNPDWSWSLTNNNVITGFSLLLSPRQWEITLDISFHVNRLGCKYTLPYQ